MTRIFCLWPETYSICNWEYIAKIAIYWLIFVKKAIFFADIIAIIKLMQIQDEMRFWIRNRLLERGRGSRKELADFLGLTPDQITCMLNTEGGKAVRNIKAEEWLKIEQFFAPEKPLEKVKDQIFTEPTRLIKIYDSSQPEQQKTLLEFAEFLSRQTKKQ